MERMEREAREATSGAVKAMTEVALGAMTRTEEAGATIKSLVGAVAATRKVDPRGIATIGVAGIAVTTRRILGATTIRSLVAGVTTSSKGGTAVEVSSNHGTEIIKEVVVVVGGRIKVVSKVVAAVAGIRIRAVVEKVVEIG